LDYQRRGAADPSDDRRSNQLDDDRRNAFGGMAERKEGDAHATRADAAFEAVGDAGIELGPDRDLTQVGELAIVSGCERHYPVTPNVPRRKVMER
jgi:hypothetical protein